MFRNRISIFIATFLIIGFFFLSLPEKGYSGTPTFPPTISGCCQYVGSEGQDICTNISGPLICPEIGVPFEDFFEGESCNQDTGLCIDPEVISAVPTLSEWGLISLAVVLGLLGIGAFLARRRKATA